MHTGLCSQSKTLLCGSTTTDDCSVAVEVLGDFLERSVAGLDVEEVDDNKLDCEPDIVEDIVFPAERLDSNWVDVLVEEDCRQESVMVFLRVRL